MDRIIYVIVLLLRVENGLIVDIISFHIRLVISQFLSTLFPVGLKLVSYTEESNNSIVLFLSFAKYK